MMNQRTDPYRPVRRILAILFLLPFVVADVPAIAAEAGEKELPKLQTNLKPFEVVELDRGYRVVISDLPGGYMHITVKRSWPQMLITTESAVKISIKRGPQSISIAMASTFVETESGQALSAVGKQQLGPSEVIQTMVFDKDSIELITEQQGQETRRRIPPLKDSWMPPAAAGRYIHNQLKKGVKEFSYRSVDPTTGPKVIESKVTVSGRENIEVMGKTVPAIVVLENQSLMPGQTIRSYVDENGVALKMTVPMIPGMSMKMVQADRAIATGKVKPQELLVRSLVEPDGAIEKPRSLRRGVYQLQFQIPKAQGAEPQGQKDEAFVELPHAGFQSVKWLGKDRVQVTIDLDKPVSAKADRPTPSHSRASVMLNSDDEKVKALTAKALKDQPRDVAAHRKALLMVDYVRQYISEKNLGVALASASDVARTAQGDCTEHAVLLAAMLRVEKIPSRTVTGLVYVDQFVGKKKIFGYHMWTQAWIKRPGDVEAHWVDLDAAMPGKIDTFDATHIALGHSAMDDTDGMVDMVHASSVIGRLSIKVIEPVTPKK